MNYHLKLVLLYFVFLSAKSFAQCDSSEFKIEGTLASNANTTININIGSEFDKPPVGTKGELNKFFEKQLFGMFSSGTLGIATAEVVKCDQKTLTLKVLKQKSEMVINGVKKNHFEAGKLVEFTWKEGPQLTPYYKIIDGDTLTKGQLFCGLETGEWTTFYASGKIEEVQFYKDGKLHGEYLFYNEDGILIEKGNFNNGIREGEYHFYYNSGKIERKGNYKNEKIHGKVEQWSENGNKEFESNYINGVLNGVFKNYGENGLLKNEGSKLNGLTEGEYKSYDENGNLDFTCTYEKGIKNGPIISYYPSGKKHIESNFKNNLKDGQHTEYFENGQIHIQCILTNDQFSGPWVENFENGKTMSKGSHNQSGLKIGTWVWYYVNGQIERTGAYDAAGKQNGLWTFYAENGSITSEGNYKNGTKVGKWVETNTDGKKKKVKY
jgi:antitoxin component YwqK of YwqJK toxin-antitoxin module